MANQVWLRCDCPACPDLARELAPALRRQARRALTRLAKLPEAAPRGGPLELSVLLVDDAGIRPLNRDWRGKDSATDVLSFGIDEGPVLGDVVISVETAARRVRARDWELLDETLFLLLHGLLHLLGHDHERDEERRRMEAAEQALWTALGRAGTLRAE
jgi:probable rRNA maturation factor